MPSRTDLRKWCAIALLFLAMAIAAFVLFGGLTIAHAEEDPASAAAFWRQEARAGRLAGHQAPVSIIGRQRPREARDAPVGAPLELHAAVTAAARRHGVPVAVAHAVVRVESGYNCGARNRSGARGIMQLMPGTARALGAGSSCAGNLDAGMRLLARIVHAHGVSCAALSLYERGEAARPRCTAYGARVMHLAARL